MIWQQSEILTAGEMQAKDKKLIYYVTWHAVPEWGGQITAAFCKYRQPAFGTLNADSWRHTLHPESIGFRTSGTLTYNLTRKLSIKILQLLMKTSTHWWKVLKQPLSWMQLLVNIIAWHPKLPNRIQFQEWLLKSKVYMKQTACQPKGRCHKIPVPQTPTTNHSIYITFLS